MSRATVSASLLVAAMIAAPALAQSDIARVAAIADTAALDELVRQRPDTARDSLERLLALSTAASVDTIRTARLAAATRIARSYARVWGDSFPLRRTETFAASPPEWRVAKVAVDSLRRAGNRASTRSGTSAAMRLWRQSLRRARAIDDTPGQAAAIGNIGSGFYRMSELDSATMHLVRARDLALTVGDTRTAANAIDVLALVAQDRGDLADAQRLFARALAMRERIGDVGGMAADQNNLGLVAQELGDLRSARSSFEAALAINRRHARHRQMATNLTNLANLASLDGDYHKASAFYTEALSIYRRLGDRVDAGDVLHNIGLLELRRGAYRRAYSVLGEALSAYEATGSSTDALMVRRDLAVAASAMGDLQGALVHLRRAERGATETGSSLALRAALAMTRADLSLQLNRLEDASRAFSLAGQLYRAASDPAGQAGAQHGRALLLLLRQDHVGALDLFRAVVRIDESRGDRRAAATTRLMIGHVQLLRGDTAAARRDITLALRSLGSTGDAVGEAAALGALGDLELAIGMSAAAESLYQRGLTRLSTRAAPSVAWQLRAGLGEALHARGALGDASRQLHAAIGEVERVSSTLRVEESRGAFLEDKWSMYARLALVERARNRPADAFAVSERLRARQMLDLFARGSVSTAPVADSSRAHEQNLRRRIAELTAAMDGGRDIPIRGASTALRGSNIVSAPVDATRDALDAAQRAYADLLLRLREESPEYARVINGETVEWNDVAARLAPDEALIEYLVADSTSLAFIVTREGVETIDLHVTRRTLATLVEFARATLARPRGTRAGELWHAPLRRLHDYLIEPLEGVGHLSGKRSLILVPHAELHYLPFAALMRDRAPRRYLVERFAISYAPSASLWVRLNDKRARQAGNAVLALAPRPVALPGSREEVQTLRRLFGSRATVLSGPAATEAAFRSSAPNADIVHLATFGVLNKRNPLFSFVQLARDARDDGTLEVHEVLGLSLDARLVVLSACQTALGSGALGDVPAGDDWVGLVRAFLFSGAANVMGTLWPVEDRITARLMERFYVELNAGRSERDALAAMQRDALRNGATAHPFFWAGLAMFGQ